MYPLASPDKPFDLLQIEERMADFEEKNRILNSRFEVIDQAGFYRSLFHTEDLNAWVLDCGEDMGRMVQRVALKDLPLLCGKNSVYVYPAEFWQWVKDSLIDRLYAFVMDMDKMRPLDLERLLNQLEDSGYPMPTMIVNSGSGVHFYYVLEEAAVFDPRITYGLMKKTCAEVYEELHRKMSDLYTNVQRHHVAQSYRLVGSRTKYNQLATAFVSGWYYTLEGLCEFCGIDYDRALSRRDRPATARQKSYALSIARGLELDPPDLESMEETKNFIERYESEFKILREKEKENYRPKKPRGHGGWYQDTRWKVRRKTERGHRYDSLRALAIIAVKSGISYEQFEKDILDISDFWRYGGVYTRDPWTQEHVPAILRSYHWAELHGRMVRSEELERMLGWKFRRRPVKRNYRDQVTHLKIARATRDILHPDDDWRIGNGRPKGSGTKRDLVVEYFREHPDSTVRQAASDLQISKTTVQKWKGEYVTNENDKTDS